MELADAMETEIIKGPSIGAPPSQLPKQKCITITESSNGHRRRCRRNALTGEVVCEIHKNGNNNDNNNNNNNNKKSKKECMCDEAAEYAEHMFNSILLECYKTLRDKGVTDEGKLCNKIIDHKEKYIPCLKKLFKQMPELFREDVRPLDMIKTLLECDKYIENNG